MSQRQLSGHPQVTVAGLGIFLTFVIGACNGGPNATEILGAGLGDAAAGAYCLSLAACCPELPSEVVASCKQLAAQAGDEACATEVRALGAHCAPYLTLPDAGSATDATAAHVSAMPRDGGTPILDAAVACTLLGTCCGSPALPSSELASCQSIEGAGDENQCAALFDDLTASSACTGSVGVGSGGACPGLQACCTTESFPAQFITECQGTVAAGQATACADDLATFVPAGYCGAVLADGGHTPDPDCTVLSMCCNEITFPRATLSTCQSLASANVGGSCASAYESYSALGYCE